MCTQRILYLIFWLSLLALCGCGPLFKVAPLPKSPPADLVTATAPGGLEIGASALTDDISAIEQFGANLPLAGLVAVEVELTNRGTEPIKASALRFELRDAAGGRYKRLETKKALGRLMKYYQKRTYLKESYRQTRESMESLALPLSSPLAPQEERHGFLFFEAKQDVAQLTGLTLSVEGGPSPIEMKLK